MAQGSFSLALVLILILSIYHSTFQCQKTESSKLDNNQNNSVLTKSNDPPRSFKFSDLNLANCRLSITSFKNLQSTNSKSIKCGHPINTYDQRIVGGRTASITDFP